MTAEEGFAVDRHAAAGRKSHCRACDRKRRKVYYAAHKDELYAAREAAREAGWQAELEALEVEHKKRVAEQKKLHAAQVRPPICWFTRFRPSSRATTSGWKPTR